MEMHQDIQDPLIKLWTHVQAIVQRGSVRFRRNVVDNTQFGCSFVSADDSKVWQVMKSARSRIHNCNRFNNHLLQLILYDIVIITQGLFQLVQQPLKPVVAKLVNVWEGFMKVFTWICQVIALANSSYIVFFWLVDTKRLKVPERA